MTTTSVDQLIRTDSEAMWVLLMGKLAGQRWDGRESFSRTGIESFLGEDKISTKPCCHEVCGRQSLRLSHGFMAVEGV